MFKLVKWAFKLGQHTERMRIAGILNEARANLPFGEYGTGNDKDMREAAKEHSARYLGGIIGNIVDPRDYERKSFSVLFPEDKE